MKKLIAILAIASSLFAVDYADMTMDELANARGTVAPEDRDAFQKVYRDRMQYLTPDEKAQYSGQRNQSASGNGVMTQNRVQQKIQKRLKDGTGGGNMYKGSRGGGRN